MFVRITELTKFTLAPIGTQTQILDFYNIWLVCVTSNGPDRNKVSIPVSKTRSVMTTYLNVTVYEYYKEPCISKNLTCSFMP